MGYERDIAHEAFAIWHAARNQVEPFAEVMPALEKLKRRFRLATLSNGNADLAVIGLAHHFEVSLSAGALGCAKPDPRAYERLADALTLRPAEILFVGDEPHADVVGPRTAGMQTVWVNRAVLFGPTRCPRRMPASPTSTGSSALLTENVNGARARHVVSSVHRAAASGRRASENGSCVTELRARERAQLVARR